MRVAYVLRYYPALSETFVVREIQALQAAGVEVLVISMGTREDSVQVEPVPGLRVLPAHRKLGARRLHLRLPHVDRFHAHFEGEASTLARDLARLRGVPYSLTVHAVGLFKPRPGIQRRLREAAPVFTVCEHHRRWIAERYGVEAQVLRCGVDLPVHPARPDREPPLVVSVGRDVPKKGAARVRRALRGRAHVHIADWAPWRVRALLPTAQLFVLGNRVAPDGDRDGVPVALMEAMAAGLPVVTRPVAGIPELVDERVGWIAWDLERALGEALSDPRQRALRGAAARARIAGGWTGAQVATQLLQAWGRVRS